MITDNDDIYLQFQSLEQGKSNYLTNFLIKTFGSTKLFESSVFYRIDFKSKETKTKPDMDT